MKGLLVREGKKEGRGQERRGGRRKEGENRGLLVMWPKKLSALNPPLDVPGFVIPGFDMEPVYLAEL